VVRHIFQACPVWHQASYSPEYIIPTQQISILICYIYSHACTSLIISFFTLTFPASRNFTNKSKTLPTISWNILTIFLISIQYTSARSSTRCLVQMS
jgi:hypothetical protein